MKRKSEAGQVLMMAAVGLTILMLAAGLAIDMGYLRYQKRRQQTAADSAAIAGASQISNCAGTPECLELVQAAKTDSSCNGYADPETAILCNDSTSDPDVLVQVENPPLDGPNSGKSDYVEVIVTRNQPTFFMKIAGYNKVAVTARAVAHLGSSSGCIYATGTGGIGPSPDISMYVVANCAVFDNGPLNVPVDSDYFDALGIGDADGQCTGSCHHVSSIQKIVPTTDPLPPLTFPNSASQSCPPGGFTSGTVPSGTYNCTLEISGSGTVTFDGTYTLEQGLTIGCPNCTGIVQTGPDGVTFYNAGGSININPGANADDPVNPPPQTAGDTVTLVAPTTGAYSGILFYQDPSNSSPATFNIDAYPNIPQYGSYLQGALHLPNAPLTITGFGGNNTVTQANLGAAYTILDATQLFLNGNLSFGSNYSSLTNGSPIKAAVLAE